MDSAFTLKQKPLMHYS